MGVGDPRGFKEDLKVILNFEGGYVNNPSDGGGATNKGITQATYTAYRQANNLNFKDVKEIDDSEVTAIYLDFYNSCGADRVAEINPRMATELFDFAINAGPVQAVKTLQRSVGAYPDGMLGPATLNAIRNQLSLIEASRAFALQRIAFYFKICQQKPNQKQFLMSWLSRPLIIEGLV